MQQLGHGKTLQLRRFPRSNGYEVTFKCITTTNTKPKQTTDEQKEFDDSTS